jgi:hypothetical protein
MKSVLKALAIFLAVVSTFAANAQEQVWTPAGETKKVSWHSVLCSGNPF